MRNNKFLIQIIKVIRFRLLDWLFDLKADFTSCQKNYRLYNYDNCCKISSHVKK